ncbi:CdaR family protein [Bacteroides sp. 51]|uniref:CdaR family protein n=1 Tax=Bacteroides sp. 51 TaxID=2302938 RepID=UPI0013D6632F|nr:YbbR-like domain-containing protein [Bacteroides sp. 51]NDV83859.1 YbbR-like domain-containing protein [Bacteroides sp. 51]
MVDRRKIEIFYSRLSKRIKNFLLSKQSREFFVFLLFFFIAGAFWLLQTLNDDYEADLTMPVRLRGVPNNVVMTSEPPSELKVRVKDKGVVLLNYMVARNFYPVNLEFSDYKGTNNHIKIYATEFEKKILSQLNASTRLLSVRPDTLDYIYSTGKSKYVPVKLQGKVSSARQYYIPDTIYNPDSVLVYAPSALLDTIRYAFTERIALEDISDTTKYQANIRAVKGAKFVPNTVGVTFPVDIYIDKTVEVPLIGANFPGDKILRTFPSKVKVTFQVGKSKFKDIEAENFIIRIPYEELLRLNASDKYKLTLRTIPDGVSHVRISPEEIDFLIEQVNTTNVD